MKDKVSVSLRYKWPVSTHYIISLIQDKSNTKYTYCNQNKGGCKTKTIFLFAGVGGFYIIYCVKLVL